MIAAVSFPVAGRCRAVIYPSGSYNNIDWKNGQSSILGEGIIQYAFIEEKNKKTRLIIDIDLDGKPVLRLIETKHYILRIENNTDNMIELPHLPNQDNKNLHIINDKEAIDFQFVNYLGKSRFFFEDKGLSIPFEVIPDKMDYEDDYIKLTEDIAEKCAALLLEYSGSTSDIFRPDYMNDDNLLEQFIFLRQFCYSENIRSLFESVKRNPDRHLIRLDEMKPFGKGKFSRNVFTHPFTAAKGWHAFTSEDGSCYLLPEKAAVTHKEDSLDTPANRFMKAALQYFDHICTRLLNALKSDGASLQTECFKEAEKIHDMLREIFVDPFFKDIGEMDIMPQDNQVLEKREGYHQIFSAYCMIDLALQLDWKGQNDVYDGESKDVATLYEYWLFFELYSIIESIDGCERIIGNVRPFVKTGKGKLTLSLRYGRKSCQSFLLRNESIKLNLYYNRTFKPEDFTSTRYEGSYSREFRPDYTIAVFPEEYRDERAAVLDGKVSYIHFDAKYRLKDLTDFIRQDNRTQQEEEEDFAKEERDSVINVYRRGDLFKMHTYKDAIRRTIGSYILYPGRSDREKDNFNIYHVYDEILPGVGAFAIRPGSVESGEEVLKKFILDLIHEKKGNSTRLNRILYFMNMVITEPHSPEAEGLYSESVIHDQNRELCVIGHIRADTDSDYYFFLRNNGFLKKGQSFAFYYYAIRNGNVLTHHQDLAKAKWFRFYVNDVQETGIYRLEPVICRIEDASLISRKGLVAKLNQYGFNTSEKDHIADFYYLMHVKVVAECNSIEITRDKLDEINGNGSFMPDSPKILELKKNVVPQEIH